METGALAVDPIEAAFNRLQIEIFVSRRLILGEWPWELDLNSAFWRLYVNNRSGASIIYKNKEIPLRPGRIYIVPAWVRFQTRVYRRGPQNFIHFSFIGLPSTLMRRIFHKPILLPTLGLLRELSHRWQAGLTRTRNLNDWEWARALVHAAVATMSSRLSTSDQRACFQSLTQTHRMRPALEAIEQRLAHPPTNPELAAMCHYSTDHFIREFNRILGMTPSRYGLERRIAIAAQWLTTSARSIEDIAEKTGFTDRFHFSRVFKTHIKSTPAAYRRMHGVAGE